VLKRTVKLFLLLSLSLSSVGHAHENQIKILKTTGRIDSKKTPNVWIAINHTSEKKVYPCSIMVPFHSLFNKMHKYGESQYREYVEKQGVIGYKIWYDLKEGKGKFSAEREWDYKIVVCDWER